MWRIKPGVVCVQARSSGPGPGSSDAYLVATGRKAAWWAGDGEGHSAHERTHGDLMAVVSGEGEDPAAATTAATSVARVLVKLWTQPPGEDREEALVAYLRKAHARMRTKIQQRQGAPMGASVAVAWWWGHRLAWAQVGDARLFLVRGGRLRALASSWPEGEGQRLMAGSVGFGDDGAIHFRSRRNRGTIKLEAGDRVALLTAGAWDQVDRPTLEQLLLHVDDPQTAAVTVADRAHARGVGAPVCALVVDHEALPSSPEEQEPSPPPAPTPPSGERGDDDIRYDAPPPRRRRGRG